MSPYAFLMLIFVFEIAPAFAQDTTWRCTYGGDGYDEGRAVIQTFDGSRLLSASSWLALPAADSYRLRLWRIGCVCD